MGDEHVRLCCFFRRDNGVVFAEEDDDEKNFLLCVSLVERKIDLGNIVVEDEEECSGVGRQRPNPKATKTVFTSKIPRVNERSAGVEQVEQEEEPRREKCEMISSRDNRSLECAVS